MTNKYDGKDDLHMHLGKCAQYCGEKPQPEWVHLFCHTLDVVPMNWCVETKICHGTSEWNILCEGFIRTFIFEDRFNCIDEALQEVKATTFRIA